VFKPVYIFSCIVFIYESFRNGAYANLGEITSVQEWLNQINMTQYTENFVKAGYMDIEKVKSLGEDDLKGMGVRLIGHRNKMNKSIKALKNHSDDNE